jgi:hypothetical protein
MIDDIITIVYILGYLFTFRYVVRAIAWSGYNPNQTNRTPDPEDWFFGIFLGFFASFVWPATLVIAYMLAHPIAFDTLFGAPAKVKRAQREQSLKAREREVARLERELGIGQKKAPVEPRYRLLSKEGGAQIFERVVEQ